MHEDSYVLRAEESKYYLYVVVYIRYTQRVQRRVTRVPLGCSWHAST